MKKILFAIMLTLFVTSIEGQAQNNITHTVQRGETLELIAQKYGVSVDQIKQINPNMDFFFTGLKIQIPAGIESGYTYNNQSSNSSRTTADNTNSFHSDTANTSYHTSSAGNNDMLSQAALFESEGKNSKALKIYRKVAKTSDDAEVWFRYGRCCYNAGKWKEAIKALESVPYKASATQEINKSAQKILANARVERENQLERRNQFWASVGETFLTIGTMAATTYAETQYAAQSGNSYSNSNTIFNTYGADKSYLLDPNYVMGQVRAQEQQEYQQAKRYRPDLTFEQYELEKAQAYQAVKMEERNNATGTYVQPGNDIQGTNKRDCSYCHGTGRVAKDMNPPQFGIDNNYKIKCNECGEMVLKSSGHTHITCPICHGKK